MPGIIPPPPSGGSAIHFHNPFNFTNPPDFGAAPNPNTGGSAGGGGAAGGSDWQHLMVRGAEFIVGAVLIYAGLAAMLRRTDTAQTIIQTTGAVTRSAAR